MKKQKLFFILFVIFSVAIACSVFSPSNVNEDLPGNNTSSPALVKPTKTPPSPDTPLPDAPEPVPTSSSSSSVGLEKIHIINPGAMSELRSPVYVSGFSAPSFEQNLTIKITDISGATLALQSTIIVADIGQGGPFNTDVVVSVSAPTQARLSIYHNSPKDGGLIHVSSIPITIIPSGPETINSPASNSEVIEIYTPTSNQAFSGGTLSFSGYSEYFFESNLSVVLCGEGGSGAADEICGTVDNVLLETYTMIASPDMGFPGPFSDSLSYSVSAPTQGRLVIFARSPMDGGIEHLNSVNVLLNP